MNLNNLKNIIAVFFVISIPFIIGLNIMIIQKAYKNYEININNYEPAIFYFKSIECTGDQSDAVFCYVAGEINNNPKILNIENSLNINKINFFYVFDCKSKRNLLARKKNELVLNKEPYRNKFIFFLILPFLINPLLWFLWKYLTKNL